MRRALIVVLSLALLAAACGDDDAGGDQQTEAAVQSLRAQIVQSRATADPSDPFAFDDDQALCAARGMVDALGARWVVENSQKEFETAMAEATPQQRRSVVDVILGCVDAETAFTDMFSADGSVSADSARCVAQAMLGSEDFLTAVADSLTGDSFSIDEDPAVIEALLPAFFDCLSAEELANLGG